MKHKPIIKVLLSVLLVTVALVGGTLAYLVASDDPIINTFKLANVNTEINEPEDGGNASTKTPWVENIGESTVFVRAKAVVVTGDGSSVPVTEADLRIDYNNAGYHKPASGGNSWEDKDGVCWMYGDDGWYYYNRTLKKGEKTEPLFDGVTVNPDLDKGAKFDIYVYHESVIVGPDEATDGNVTVEVAQEAFW